MKTPSPPPSPASSPWRLLPRILRHEALRLRRDRAAGVVLAILALCTAYAAWNGANWRHQRSLEVRATVDAAESELAAQRQAMAAGETGIGIDTPGSPKQVAVLPPGPLADFALGPSDLLPHRAKISVWERADNLFGEYQLASPATLFAGRFDLAFVLVVLLPLGLVALSFDLVSAEREGGTLPLLRAQSVDLRVLVTGKLGVIGGAALATVGVLSGAGLFLGGFLGGFLDTERLARFGLFLGVLVLYALFWLGLAAGVATLGRRSETNALLLVGAWLLVVLVIPGILAVLVDLLQPLPSRLDALAVQRAEAAEAAREGEATLDDYYQDHPELASVERQGGFLPSFFAQQRRIEARTMREVEAFEERLAAQQSLVRRLSILSPAVAAREALYALAGSDTERHREFVQAARGHLEAWNKTLSPKIFRDETLTLAEFDRLPAFRFEEPAPSRSTSLLFFACIVLWLLLVYFVTRRSRARAVAGRS